MQHNTTTGRVFDGHARSAERGGTDQTPSAAPHCCGHGQASPTSPPPPQLWCPESRCPACPWAGCSLTCKAHTAINPPLPRTILHCKKHTTTTYHCTLQVTTIYHSTLHLTHHYHVVQWTHHYHVTILHVSCLQGVTLTMRPVHPSTWVPNFCSPATLT